MIFVRKTYLLFFGRDGCVFFEMFQRETGRKEVGVRVGYLLLGNQEL